MLALTPVPSLVPLSRAESSALAASTANATRTSSATLHTTPATTSTTVENKRVDALLANPLQLSKLFPLWNRDFDTPSGDSEFNLLTRIDSASALVKRLAPGWFPNSNTPGDLSALIADLVLQQSRDFLLKEAELSANNFEIPESVLTDELALLTRAARFLRGVY